MSSAARPEALEPGEALQRYFAKLLGALGPQDWWPARTRLEVILGAILVQNTAWTNAVLALKRLRRKGFLTLSSLRSASPAEIEECVRPAGFYRQKARTIFNFLAWLEHACDGSLNAMFTQPPQEARRQLLKVKGLGPETVDAILLYAGKHPVFVADGYARRIFSRHDLVAPHAEYHDVQEYLHRHLPADTNLFNEFHALLVEAGKLYCRKQAPRCGECPLEEFLPAAESSVQHFAR